MEGDARIYVAGGDTLIGAALLREIRRRGFTALGGTKGEPDPTDPAEVDAFLARERPDYMIIAAGKSGGITANVKYPADLLIDNLKVLCALFEPARRRSLRKVLYLASSCSYPRLCAQPMREDQLLTGPLEPTNEAYATGKLAGAALCRAFRVQHRAPFVCAIPANVFGPGDDFSLEDSHVIAALIRKMDEAARRDDAAVVVWGTGRPRRDFLYADDCAAGCLHVLEAYDDDAPINIGSGLGVTIAELAHAIKEVVGFTGELRFDADKPDGMPVKILDTGKLQALGFRPRVDLARALRETYSWYLETIVRAPSPGAPQQ